ncbi:MAG: aminotransferase class I/II-fold pyridoxal phosphate-dependent enzyme [Gammaproteobacteria bacterium]
MTTANKIPLESLLVTLPATFHDALEAINTNTLGIVFFVDEAQRLIGVFTDGDARRALLNGAALDQLITDATEYFNHSPHSLPFDCEISEIWGLLEQDLRCIPLVDETGRVVDFSTRSRIRQFMVLQPDIGEQEISNVLECVTTGWISSQGQFIPAFERQFSEYLGGGHALAVSNGTVALQLGLTALGIGQGDEVVVPDFTFGASINAIIHAGATPVLADIDPETWTIDLNALRTLITSKTKAIMPVHIYGQPARIDEINKIATENNLLIIEDCAEALGATYKSRRVGLDGDCSCFSFFANKSITTGEGGMVVFKDEETAQRARVLRDHGMSPQKRYWHDYAGFNFRMTNMQAAIGVAQMGRIDELLSRKKRIFQTYDHLLSKHPGVSLLPKNDWSENSYWLYTIMINGYAAEVRDQLITHLGFRGIDARPGFYPMHQMEPYRDFAHGNYPVADDLSAKSISLPSSFGLSNEEVPHIVEIFLDELSKFTPVAQKENVK